jgi:hypothetical protein
VQQQVANLFKGKILVGHSIWNDLSGVYFHLMIETASQY